MGYLLVQKSDRRETTTTAVLGCVLTSFGRVGTVGMERGYSWPFVPFQPVFRCLCPFQLQKEKAGIAANSVRSVTFWTVNIKH